MKNKNYSTILISNFILTESSALSKKKSDQYTTKVVKVHPNVLSDMFFFVKSCKNENFS